MCQGSNECNQPKKSFKTKDLKNKSECGIDIIRLIKKENFSKPLI
jgi:hypothetical protein